MSVGIIEYGIGNVHSVYNAVRRIGAAPSIVSDGKSLAELNADCIILPGVGAVGRALKNLRARGFQEVLECIVLKQKTPICGICVGMQLFCETCEEFGFHQGFRWIPGHVGRLEPREREFKLPHIGWNTLTVTNLNDPIFGALHGKDAYFAHSFSLRCPDEFVISTTYYGERFVSAVRRDNIIGVQFHPEKSSSLGDVFIKSFLQYAEKRGRFRNV